MVERGTATKSAPEIGQEVWRGTADNRKWVVRRVEWPRDEPPLVFDPEFEEDQREAEWQEIWRLAAETTDGGVPEVVNLWWTPADRVLGGELKGWAKRAIGSLKTTLHQRRWSRH